MPVFWPCSVFAFCMILTMNSNDVAPYSTQRLALLMVKVCVLCEVRTKSIYMWYIWALKILMTLSNRQVLQCPTTGLSVPVNARSKAWVCRRWLAVCLLWVLCVVKQRSLRRADPSSRGVLPRVVCLCVIPKPQQWGSLGPNGAVATQEKKNYRITGKRQLKLMWKGLVVICCKVMYWKLLGVTEEKYQEPHSR
jgi:hypothetical protein